jgi:hypothetical protein
MSPLNKKDLSKLSPDARLRKLKEIEDQHEKEIEEVKDLISKSKKELIEIEREEELEYEEPDDDFEGLAQRIMPEEESGLENIARTESLVNQEEEDMASIYQQLVTLEEEGGSDNYGNMAQAFELYERINEIGNTADQYNSQTEAMKEIAQGSKRIIKQLMGNYQSKQDYSP